MAFQRPFLIILKREEPGQPWGFRVSGGADLATPPRVDKVGRRHMRRFARKRAPSAPLSALLVA